MEEPSEAIQTVALPRCGQCGRVLRPGFRLRGGDLRCGQHVIQHPAVWKRSLATAAIVGTVLTAINQGNFILGHGFSQQILLKMGLTYCVPFCVSTSGALGAARIRPETPGG
ncbi:MAG TPA: nitrate/nitrite transporter NrtS [Dehalococcoidia bacterium]|nr:nitrate/nitrite transporter NrtS [Dehalococcoidia bacterium]